MSKKPGKDTCIILPCAGKGTRLGLAASKEIYQVEPNKKLIDYSLNHIKKSNYVSKIVIVIHPSKIDLINYIHSIKETLPPISFVFQKENYFDWPGGIWSAEDLLDENNIALLPDSVLIPKNKSTSIIDQMREKMLGGDHITFSYKKEDDKNRIKSLGALYVDETTNEIKHYKEKPQKNTDDFNAFWCSFGFKKESSNDLFRLMESLTKKDGEREFKEIKDKYKIAGIEIEEYHDLGTWDNLQKYISEGGIK